MNAVAGSVSLNAVQGMAVAAARHSMSAWHEKNRGQMVAVVAVVAVKLYGCSCPAHLHAHCLPAQVGTGPWPALTCNMSARMVVD